MNKQSITANKIKYYWDTADADIQARIQNTLDYFLQEVAKGNDVIFRHDFTTDTPRNRAACLLIKAALGVQDPVLFAQIWHGRTRKEVFDHFAQYATPQAMTFIRNCETSKFGLPPEQPIAIPLLNHIRDYEPAQRKLDLPQIQVLWAKFGMVTKTAPTFGAWYNQSFKTRIKPTVIVARQTQKRQPSRWRAAWQVLTDRDVVINASNVPV